MKTPDLNLVSDIIVAVSEAEVMPRFNHLSVSDVGTKESPEDLVTVADTETEKKLTARLQELLPSSAVVGEEAAFRDPSVLDALNGDAPVWIIDPIDGTSNFAYGRPEIGVVVALVYKGEAVAGWLYHPVKKIMIMGEKGAGVRMRDKTLSVAKVSDVRAMNGVVGRNVAFRDPAMPKPVYWGSASYGYILLVTGCVHYSAYRTGLIKPWDHAAGVMLHAEAGGYSAFLDAEPYTPFMSRKHLISAPNKDAWEYLAQNMQAARAA